MLAKRTPAQLMRNANENDLHYTSGLATRLQSVAVCQTEQDYQTRAILEKMLADTDEDHAYRL